METGRLPKKVMQERVFSSRRNKQRWLADVIEDLRLMGIKNWKEKAKNREEWRHLVYEVKAHPGL